MSDDSDDVLRLGYRDVIDTSDNMALITESLKGLKDFTMRFDTDVILCKFLPFLSFSDDEQIEVNV